MNNKHFFTLFLRSCNQNRHDNAGQEVETGRVRKKIKREKIWKHFCWICCQRCIKVNYNKPISSPPFKFHRVAATQPARSQRDRKDFTITHKAAPWKVSFCPAASLGFAICFITLNSLCLCHTRCWWVPQVLMSPCHGVDGALEELWNCCLITSELKVPEPRYPNQRNRTSHLE